MEKKKKSIFKRWWFWVLVVIVVGAVAGGGSGSDSKEKKDEKGSKVSVESDTPDEITVEEQVIFDKKDVKVTVKGYKQDDIWGDCLQLEIENNTSKNICITTGDTTSVNGIMVTDTLYASVASGKKANEDMTFYNTDFDAAGIETVKDIEFSLKIYDEDSFDDIANSDLIKITTNAPKDFVQEIDRSGELAVDQNDVKIYVKKVDSEESFWGADIYIMVENNTGKDVNVFVDEVSVNGFMLDPIFASFVRKDTVAYDSITFLDTDLEDNGIESIKDIELSFEVSDNKTFDRILKTKPVKIDIK